MANIYSKQALESHIRNIKKEEWGNLEKILITVIAGGFLGSSLTLVTTLKGTITFLYKSVLVWSWVFFGGCIVFLILSYVSSDLLSQFGLKRLKEKPDNFPKEEWENVFKGSWLQYSLLVFNWLSVSCAILGIITLVVFGALNFS